jgi:hypothetical protein
MEGAIVNCVEIKLKRAYLKLAIGHIKVVLLFMQTLKIAFQEVNYT